MIYFEDTIVVRYYETDKMGIVHHSNYIRFFECARVAFMEKIGYSILRCEQEGIMMPVVEVNCVYKYPTTVGDRLRVSVEIEKLPTAKFTMKQRIFNQEGILCASGFVTVGFLNSKTNKVQACPESFYNLLEKEINKS